MPPIRLIHWNAEEAEERAERLRAADYEVEFAPLDSAGIRAMRDAPPSAVVIDLGRLPAQGRDMGMMLRKYKDTRHVPLVFVEGSPEKVARIQELLPDAVYTTWEDMPSALMLAIANPPKEPVVPASIFEAYEGTPLPKKLGIKENSVVVLVGAPDEFEATLGELPDGVTLRRGARGRGDVTLWFLKQRKNLEGRIEKMGIFIGEGTLWVIWPKKASKVTSDLTQPVVRKIGLASGLVDFKVCSVDEVWTGLCFTRRKKK